MIRERRNRKQKLVICFLVISLLLLPSNVKSCSECSKNQIEWLRTYSGSLKSSASSIIRTFDGGFVVAGNDFIDEENDDALLLKTDNEGKMIWNKTYGGLGSDKARVVIQTNDGGLALAGSTSSYGSGDSDVYLIKTDSEGEIKWEGAYGGYAYDGAYGLVQTQDKGFVLAGFTNSYGAGQYDAYVVKTDSEGIIEWNKTYTGTWSGTQYDGAYDIIQTTEGGYAIVGFTSFGFPDMLVVKINSEGIEEWTQSYGGLFSDTAYSILQTQDEGFVFTGFTQSVGAGESDILLVKTDSNGLMEWHQTFGGVESENAHALIQTFDGGFALAGTTSLGDHEMLFVKTNSTGHMEWNCTYGGPNADGAFSLVQTDNDSYVIVGSSTEKAVELFTMNSYEFWILKISNPSNLNKTEYNSYYQTYSLLIAVFIITIKRKRRK
jgi:hypothetical protein